MSKIYVLAILAIAFVQCKTPVKELSNKEAPVKEFANSIKPIELQAYLYALASDDFEGRETGEPGQKKAARFLKEFYVQNEIKSPLGGQDYFQDIPSSYFDNRFKETENVVAMIKGSQFPEQVVVVSAHYDHVGMNAQGQVFNGADDDGSGTVAVMQVAQAFKKAVEAGYRPKRTLLFLHFTGEEKGLLGSLYYAENPIFPLANTVADLNIDMIGRVDKFHEGEPNYVYLIGSDRLSSALDSVINQQNRKYTKLLLDYKYNAEDDPNRFYYRSDHYNFAKHNIPVVFFFNGVHEDYHQLTDTADKINYDLLSKRAKLVFYTAWEIANRDQRLVVDKAE